MAGVWKVWGRIIWTGLFAALLTVASGAVWSALFLTNLRIQPDMPWAASAMAVIAIGLWLLIGGGKRARYRRANGISPRAFLLAVAAGGACIAALAGLWIVLVEVVGVRRNAADFSHTPRLTLIASLVMASVVGGVFEEAGFRGYFQGTLERYIPWSLAVLVCALVMAPLHVATQGFVWPVLLFYLLVDIALGASAALTNSILPGILVHSAGLFAFFALIWPADKARPMFAATGSGLWFWIHAAQAVVFGIIGVWLFARLAGAKAVSK
jgi:membrane protease YdiL (CAAX protease family)